MANEVQPIAFSTKTMDDYRKKVAFEKEQKLREDRMAAERAAAAKANDDYYRKQVEAFNARGGTANNEVTIKKPLVVELEQKLAPAVQVKPMDVVAEEQARRNAVLNNTKNGLAWLVAKGKKTP